MRDPLSFSVMGQGKLAETLRDRLAVYVEISDTMRDDRSKMEMWCEDETEEQRKHSSDFSVRAERLSLIVSDSQIPLAQVAYQVLTHNEIHNY